MKNMFFNIDDVLSKQALYNFIVGGRGIGKTYSLKKRAIKNWIKDGSMFVYLRRFDSELQPKLLKHFFDDVGKEFPGYEFDYKEGMLTINEVPFGFTMALSKAITLKGIAAFDKVSIICFDEFLLEGESYYRYLPNEINHFENMLETICRLRDVPIICFSNNVSITNPYFRFYGVKFSSMNPGSYRKGDVYAEIVKSEDFLSHKARTRRARVLEGTNFYSYAIENKSLEDDSSNVKKKEGNCYCLARIIVDGVEMGVWKSNYFGIYYISPDCKDKVQTFTFDLENVESEKMLLTYRTPVIKKVMESYRMGGLFYENMDCKNLFLKIARR